MYLFQTELPLLGIICHMLHFFVYILKNQLVMAALALAFHLYHSSMPEANNKYIVLPS